MVLRARLKSRKPVPQPEEPEEPEEPDVSTPARRVRNTKAKGNAYERKSRKWLEAGGFQVIKAGGSLGAFDLVAWNDKLILFIQVKFGAWPPPEERQRLRDMPVPPAGHKFVHRWDDGRQELPTVKLIEEFQDGRTMKNPRVWRYDSDVEG